MQSILAVKNYITEHIMELHPNGQVIPSKTTPTLAVQKTHNIHREKCEMGQSLHKPTSWN